MVLIMRNYLEKGVVQNQFKPVQTPGKYQGLAKIPREGQMRKSSNICQKKKVAI